MIGVKLTPEAQARVDEQRRLTAERAKTNQSPVQSNGQVAGANFNLGKEASQQYDAFRGEADQLKATAAQRANVGQSTAFTVDELMQYNRASNDATKVLEQEQARRGGVETADAVTGAQGIAGFFGGKDTTTHYTAGHMNNPTLASNRGLVTSLAADAANRPTMTMESGRLGPAATSQAAEIGTGQQSQFRARQYTLADQLGLAASGMGGPSAAESMLNRATDRNMSQALGLALAARGGNRAAALKQAGMQRALIGQDAASQAAMLRAQEQQQAQAALGNVLASARGADIGLATDQAQLQQQTALANQQAQQQNVLQQGQFSQQTNLANLQAGIDQQKQKDALVQSYVAQGLSLDQAQYQAELQQAQFNAQLLAQQSAADKGVAMQSSAQGGQTLGAIASTLGTVLAAAASDERAKYDVKPASESKIGEFLSTAGAHDYKYKEPEKPMRGEGRFVSPMAQELEKSEIGKSMVREAPDGTKIVDYGKGFGAMLAGLSMVFKKVQKLEGKRA